MKKILTLIAVLFITAPAYAQETINVNANVKKDVNVTDVAEIRKQNREIDEYNGKLRTEERKKQGIFYLGNGQYKVTYVGGNGFVSLRKLHKRCLNDIEELSVKHNLKYEFVDSKERKAVAAVNPFPKVEEIYTLYNSDGSLALNENLGIIKEENANFDDVEKEVIGRDEAIKRIKEAKDLFDVGILSQEEYDKLVAKYKAIIMAN